MLMSNTENQPNINMAIQKKILPPEEMANLMTLFFTNNESLGVAKEIMRANGLKFSDLIRYCCPKLRYAVEIPPKSKISDMYEKYLYRFRGNQYSIVLRRYKAIVPKDGGKVFNGYEYEFIRHYDRFPSKTCSSADNLIDLLFCIREWLSWQTFYKGREQKRGWDNIKMQATA